MKTRLYYAMLLSIFFSFPLQRLQAQGSPPFGSATCSYENSCLLVSYEAVLESADAPNTLTVVLSAFLNSTNSCRNIDGLIFTPIGGTPVIRTRAQLAANSFVELTVDRGLFLATPDVIVATFRFVSLFGFRLTIPTNVVDLQARLDSNDPCLAITPLPVELVSFDGIATPNGISLSWSTASEKDNHFFAVERSGSGQTIEQIGSVSGHGTTSQAIHYSYTDPSPLPGVNYYRLKQVDFNGDFEYSKVIAVHAEAQPNLQLALAPNPCTNGNCQLSLISALPGAPAAELELTDLAGRVVFRKVVVNAGSGSKPLPMPELKAFKGVFILSATTGSNVVRQRVILQ